MEKMASDAECLLRLAEDGTVSAGNLEGLVSRAIDRTTDASSSGDERFRATFLTIYQLFSTSVRLFEILKRRFESTIADTPSQYSVLLFIESWLKKGFEDEDLGCSSKIREFALVVCELGSQELKAKAAEIASMIYNPDYVYLRQPRSIIWLRRRPTREPPGVRPSDLAAALGAVAGNWYQRITHWDYVNFTQQQHKSLNARRIELFKSFNDKVTEWVQRCVTEPRYLEERTEMFENWVYTAQECRGMNNFASASAIVTALMSPKVAMIVLACDSRAAQIIHKLNRDLAPESGAYYDTLRQAGTKELIPWLDPFLSPLNSTFANSDPTVEVDGHYLVDFKLCGELAEQIDSVTEYSPPPPASSEIRQDVLEYVEYHLQSSLATNPSIAAAARNARLARKKRSSVHSKRETKRSLGELRLPPPHQGRLDDTTRRRDVGRRRRRSTARLREADTATQRREDKKVRRHEDVSRRREGMARRREEDTPRWRKNIGRWRKDMARWSRETTRWRKSDARRGEDSEDLEQLPGEDTTTRRRRWRGLLTWVFGSKTVKTS